MNYGTITGNGIVHTLLGENLQEAMGRVVIPSLGTLPTLVLVPTTSLFSHSSTMFSQRYLSRDGALDLSTRPRVCSYFPQNPTVNPFFINYSCSPKIFSPIISFNEASEFMFNMFSFIYTYDFFPGQDNRSLLISAIKQ